MKKSSCFRPTTGLQVLAVAGAVCALSAGALAQTDTSSKASKAPSRLLNSAGAPHGGGKVSPVNAGPACTAYNPVTDCQESSFAIAYNITTFPAAEAVSATVPVTSLCVQGVYFNNVPVQDAWVVTVYTDGGGIPGTVVDTFTQGNDLVVTGPVPTGQVFAGRAVQEWNLALARPVDQGTACFWYEFRNFATGDTVFQLDGNASNGNLQAAQDLNNDGVYTAPAEVLPDDLYVCINGGFVNNAVCFLDPCAGIVPPNDGCFGAIPLSAGTVAGTTNCAGADAVTSCSGVAIGPSVWYSVAGTGNTVTIDLCASANYDTTLEVFCGGCDSPVCVTGNDDFCGLQSSVTFCTAAGENYLVLVHGFNGAAGAFDITLSDDGVPCSTPPSCAPCTTVDCPAGSIDEQEPCGGDSNGGCNATPGAYEAIVGNDTICGTSFATTATRDTDWYTVIAPASGVITATLTANFNALGLILDPGTPIPDPCGAVAQLAVTTIPPCGTGTLTATGLVPGNTYVLFVASAVFADVPCPASYVLTVDQGAGPGVPCCDFNIDGFVNSQDFFDFLIAFFAAAPNADFNADGFVNSQDFFDFIVCFFAPPAGCP